MNSPPQNEHPGIIIVTGLSGGGKTVVLRALEDAGYHCMDNIPTNLLPEAASSLLGSGQLQMAFGVDIREKDYLGRFEDVLAGIRRAGFRVEILFLEASDDALTRRFKETRRPHPLQKENVGLKEAIQMERAAMGPMRGQADRIVETTAFSPHQLRDLILKTHLKDTDPSVLRVNLISFGFKYGPPFEADLVMDVRFLPNPYFVEGLRDLSGLDPEVADFVFSQPETRPFLERLKGLLEYLVPLYRQEGKAILNIAIGCTGGRHRSPAIVLDLAETLGRLPGVRVSTYHREVETG